MKFEECVEIILDIEKGYVNHPNDPGGETNFGISKRSYPHLEIKSLTREQAIEIYRLDYWNRSSCEELPDGVRLLFFDACVNHGIHHAIMLLQKCLNVTPDGIMGPFTKEMAKGTLEGFIVKRFIEARSESYINNKNWDSFGKGWMRRLMHVALISMY